ncbi:MAG TPA: adenosylmethionine decarboxylase [Rhabdochlamydiaceae bacterium]|nr:adenosylmethionine decarboxylase [Rhabdochlamydiaceae bacterium]
MRGIIFFLTIILAAGTSHLTALDKPEYEFRGVHFMAEYCGCDEKALTDIEALKKAMHEAALASGATILESVDHVFAPNGLTLVILLSESHASIHTYPEHRACFVDLFTCGDHCSSKGFDAIMRAYLHPTEAHQKILIRSETINDKE